MNSVEHLLEARKFAGLPPLSNNAIIALAEKKLGGKEKEEFLARMGGTAKSSSGKSKKKVSEQFSAVLVGAGLRALSEQDAAKIDAQYPVLNEVKVALNGMSETAFRQLKNASTSWATGNEIEVSGTDSNPKLTGTKENIKKFLAKQWKLSADSEEIEELF